MTIKGTKIELVNLDYKQVDRNEEIAYSKGFDDVCVCCGKGIKDINKTKWIRILNLDDTYYTDAEIQVDDDCDQGWFPIGNTCYKKYKANETDIEINS
jgi:hypothetical protein